MKVAIFLFAFVAIATADSRGTQPFTYWTHVPYYNVDWQVKDDKYYIDYGQIETREHDNTRTNWWVALPGYSHIKRNDVVNTQSHHSYYSQGYESKPFYMIEYKPIQYKEEENKSVYTAGHTPNQYEEAYKPISETEYKPVQYNKEESIKPVHKNEYNSIARNKEEYKPVYDDAGHQNEEDGF